MAVTYNNSAANVNYLSAKTGLAPSVASAWLTNEGQSVGNPTNPLNIVKGGTPNQTGSVGAFGTYASPQAGLDAAAWLLKANTAYQGILVAIGVGSPVQQAQAIQNSPWAAGHYGNHNISDMVSSSGSTTPSGGASTPLTSTPSQTNPGTSATLGKLGINTDPTHILTESDIWKIAMQATQQDTTTPINANNQIYQGYLANLKGKTVAQMTADAASGVTYQQPGFTLPDVPGALMFLGVVAVGLVLILTGGIVTLKRK
jgi:hypothetical protein